MGFVNLDRIFHPKSVAVVGASPNPKGWGGTSFLMRMRDLGFTGTLYPIHPKADEILGLKTYPRVSSIPEPADLVIVAISAPGVPSVLEDCINAGVKNVQEFSELVELGLRRVFLGVESGDENLLQFLQKPATCSSMRELVEILKSSEAEGLVHCSVNHQEIEFVCNCCADHCVILKTALEQPKPGLSCLAR